MGFFRKKKVMLVLGGGSARGLCNIGVLKALEKHFGRDKMPFDMVIGTSIGSLIGAAYCLGMPIEEMEKRALKFAWPELVDFCLNSTGLIKGSKLEKIIVDLVDSKDFADMRVPFCLTTTDIQTGEELLYKTGDLVRLIRASCSWPGIFSAVEVDGRLLVDGGVRNSIPTKAAYDLGASFVLAVNPGFAVKTQNVKNIVQIMVQSIQIMGEELNAYQSKFSDMAIKPDLGDIDQFDFSRTAMIINRGEAAMNARIKDLERKLFLHTIF